MALSHGKRKRAVITSSNKQRPKARKSKNKHGSTRAMKRKFANDLDNMQVDQQELNNVSEAPHQRIHKRRRMGSEIAGMGNQSASGASLMGANTDVTRVAIRQRVHHKLMLYFFEQLIVKHSLHKKFTFDAEEVNFGVDLFFPSANEAYKFTDFCESLVPCKVARKKNNEYAVEIGCVCKGDVVCLPQRLFNKIGGKIGPLMVCCKVTKDYHFIDPITAQGFKISAQDFFKFDMKPLFSYRQLEKYTVLDVRITSGKVKQKQFVAGEVQVQKTSLIGQHLDSLPIATQCHFAHVIHPGDTLLGYDFRNSNQTEEIINTYKKLSFPDVLLVRKFHDFRSHKRVFELKQLFLERDDDFEDFLDELEEDRDLRNNINLYRNPNYEPPAGESKAKTFSGVSLDELLEGLAL